MNAQDMSAVEACIQNYFKALYTGDTDLLMGSVFHPNAHLYAADLGGGFVDWPMDEFKKVIESRPSPETTGAERRERIVSIDEAGPDTVMVKVEVLVGTRDFVDYLSLLKLDGEWRIISKTCVMVKDYAEAAA
ncbi:MAG: nuclear transport factor 2 family protein [Rhodospirillales bacterium]